MEMSTRLKTFSVFRFLIFIALLALNIIFIKELSSLSMKSAIIFIVDYLAACLLLCISSNHINLHYGDLKRLHKQTFSNSFYGVKYLLSRRLNSIAEITDVKLRSELLTEILFDMYDVKNAFDSFNAFEKIKPQTKKVIIELCDEIIAGNYSYKNHSDDTDIFNIIKESLDKIYP
jgi:hypothetical protein